MNLRIKHKLFLLLLTVNIALASIMYILTSRSFSDGFLNYVESIEQKKLSPLTKELAAIYKQEQNWQWVHADRQKWRFLINKYIKDEKTVNQPPFKVAPQARDRSQEPPFSRQPPPPPAFEDSHNPPDFQPNFRRPPPERRSPDRRPPPEGRFPDHRPPPEGRPPNRRPPPERMPPNREPNQQNFMILDSRLFLKDAKGTLILGNPRALDKVHWLPINEGKKVLAHLGYIKLERINNRLNQLFIEEQQYNFMLIALSLVLLSVLVSFPVASYFVRPIKRLNLMLKKVTGGDFKQRLIVQGHDEISDLSNNLNILAITLGKNLQARKKWVADISHELRTPVSILKGEIEAIQDGIRIADDKSIASLQHEVERLSQLINDLHELTLSDIGSLSYKKEIVDFDELIQDRIDCAKNSLKHQSIQVKLALRPIVLNADERRLEQLLDNLIQNTLRYTDSPGVLNIQLLINTGKINRQQYCSLIWQDSSPGVKKEELNKLLDHLYRTEHSRNRKTGGSGLGLAICKSIVEGHQGIIKVKHSSLGGIAIIVKLPIYDTKR